MLGRLTAEPLEFRLTGTLDDPRIQFPEGRNLLDEVTARLLKPDETNPPTSIEGAVGNLLQGLASGKDGKPDPEKTTTGILNLIEAFRKKDEPARNDQP